MAKYVSPDARARRQRKRRAQRLAVFAFLAAFVLVSSYGIVKVIEVFSGKEKTPPLIDPSQTTQPDDTQPQGDKAGWNTSQGPVKQTINFEIINPDPRMIQVAENGRVDMSYFDNATFVGDSLADGFRAYSLIENTVVGHSQFVTNRSLTPNSFLRGVISFTNKYRPTENGMEAIASTNPSKIYVLLGANAMVAQSDEDLFAGYEEFYTKLRETNPYAIIYVCSITPTTEKTSTERPQLSLERIFNVNARLAKMCNEKGMQYINLHEVLAEGAGYLAEDLAQEDGLHIKPAGYVKIIDYLISHTVHNADNPYIPGSPYYVEG